MKAAFVVAAAVLITYQAHSAPDPVTANVRRDEVQRHGFWRNGTEPMVVLSGPWPCLASVLGLTARSVAAAAGAALLAMRRSFSAALRDP